MQLSGCRVGFPVSKWRHPSSMGDRLQDYFHSGHQWSSCFYLEHTKKETNGGDSSNHGKVHLHFFGTCVDVHDSCICGTFFYCAFLCVSTWPTYKLPWSAIGEPCVDCWWLYRSTLSHEDPWVTSGARRAARWNKSPLIGLECKWLALASCNILHWL